MDQDTYDTVGTILEYLVSVTNTGNVTLTGVTVTDSAPGPGAFDATECAAVPSTILPGASFDCTVTYQVTQSDLDAPKVTNTATVSGTTPDALVVGPVTATATSSADHTTELNLVKEVEPSTFDAVDTLLDIRGDGDGRRRQPPLTDLDVTDVAPGDGAFDASSCDDLPTTLAPGALVACTVLYTTTQADLDAGEVTNTASASAVSRADSDFVVGPTTANATSSAAQSAGSCRLPRSSTSQRSTLSATPWCTRSP